MKLKDLQFTPGPWVLINDKPGSLFPRVGFVTGAVRGAYETIVVNTSHDHEEETILGNATLISHAPKMLELLKQSDEALRKSIIAINDAERIEQLEIQGLTRSAGKLNDKVRETQFLIRELLTEINNLLNS